MTSASQENARMLASLLGVEEEQAAERLDRTVLITAASDETSRAWARDIRDLVERTVRASDRPDSDIAFELVIGDTSPRSKAPRLFATIDAGLAIVDTTSVRRSRSRPHPLFAAIAACPVAGAVLSRVLDAAGLPTMALPLKIRFDEIGIPEGSLNERIDIAGSALVGAGAVGNAFLRALRRLDVHGTLPIVDPKEVGAGNPNRCLYLTDDDIGRGKAEALAGNAQADFSGLSLTAHHETFSSFVAREGVQGTAIVTVDSRRVRRGVQSDLPLRVVDASTTDVRAVVVHSHEQPTNDACLACIYRHVPNEHVREQAIADGLGIDVGMVKESLISLAAAQRIAERNPGVTASQIVGRAYDSLFKALCAEAALRTPEGRQVLAPFAFVSALAGALLVVELLRREHGVATTNYWQVDPWGAPVGRVRSLRPRASDCEFCSKPHILAAANDIWAAARTG